MRAKWGEKKQLAVCKMAELHLGGSKMTAGRGGWINPCSLSAPAGHHCLISLNNPPAPKSLVRSLEKNADLHIIKAYVEAKQQQF